MKVANLVGERFRENPSEAVLESHALLLRGGYMKGGANGIYTSYPPLRRIVRKLEGIIREEMEKLDGQEVQFPVALPASLWEESGRYESVGKELLRFQDRNGSPFVLGMTHEEAAVHLVREYGSSYARYPFMIYQIQTKFRDEARPRGGLIRVREFTMKDAYSFHTSQEDLEVFYQKCHRAYERIFARVGLPQVVSVASDSGMMGGNLSHEFMLLSPAGEDSVVLCPACGYRANMEAAPNLAPAFGEDSSAPLQMLSAPDTEAAAFSDKLCRAFVYWLEETEKYAVCFLRGGFEVNEAKLRNLLGGVHRLEGLPVTESNSPLKTLPSAWVGPIELQPGIEVLYDASLKGGRNLICGANEEGSWFRGLDIERDLGEITYVDIAKAREGGTCPCCGKRDLQIRRGIEVGNIFQLGTKYTAAMHMEYMDEEGNKRNPLMGCYGIGIGRLAASICEAHHDERGPLWPMAVAPWQVHLCAFRAAEPSVKEAAETLYSQLEKQGVEVLYDDRDVSAGVMLADADLLGIPLRVIVSPRSLREGCCEISARDGSFSYRIPLDQTAQRLWQLVKEMLAFQEEKSAIER